MLARGNEFPFTVRRRFRTNTVLSMWRTVSAPAALFMFVKPHLSMRAICCSQNDLPLAQWNCNRLSAHLARCVCYSVSRSSSVDIIVSLIQCIFAFMLGGLMNSHHATVAGASSCEGLCGRSVVCVPSCCPFPSFSCALQGVNVVLCEDDEVWCAELETP